MSALLDGSILALGLAAYGRWASRQTDTADGYDHRPIGTCFMCGDEQARVNLIRPHALLDHEPFCDDCQGSVMA